MVTSQTHGDLSATCTSAARVQAAAPNALTFYARQGDNKSVDTHDAVAFLRCTSSDFLLC